MGKIKFVAIVPGKLDQRPFQEAARVATRGYIEEDVLPQFEATVKDWSPANRPRFRIVEKVGPNSVMCALYAEGDVYRMVSEGTDVRYATMTPGFVSKTQPGVVPSRPGRGGVLYVNKSKPMPGIEAREFPRMIAQRTASKFRTRGVAALRAAVRASGHAIGR